MVQKYIANGSKNLNWGTEFLEKSSENVLESSGRKKGYYTKAQILEMHGIKVDCVDEKKADAMLKHLLEKCYKEAELDPNDPSLFQDSPFDELKEYFYIKEKDHSEDQVTSRQRELSIYTTGMKCEKIQPMLLGAGSSTDIVKVENPHYQELKNKQQAVFSAKTRLEKEILQLQDMHADMLALNKDEHKQVLKESKEKLVGMDQFLQALRKAKADMQSIDQSDKDACLDQLKVWNSLGEHMLVHMEGAKALKTKLKALL